VNETLKETLYEGVIRESSQTKYGLKIRPG
jgi:hypothetical protein